MHLQLYRQYNLFDFPRHLRNNYAAKETLSQTEVQELFRFSNGQFQIGAHKS